MFVQTRRKKFNLGFRIESFSLCLLLIHFLLSVTRNDVMRYTTSTSCFPPIEHNFFKSDRLWKTYFSFLVTYLAFMSYAETSNNWATNILVCISIIWPFGESKIKTQRLLLIYKMKALPSHCYLLFFTFWLRHLCKCSFW